jgi:5'-nucleotidase/UDP-sugar diphosphatase
MPIETGLYKPDPEILKIITNYANGIPDDFKSTVMTTTAKFNQFNASNEYLSCRQETALGNLVSDAMSWLGRNQRRYVDFAMINGNIIRTGLPMGKVTKGDLAEALPYDNTLKIVSMSGTEVAKLFDFVASIPLGNSGFPQVSKEVRYQITYTNLDGKTTGKISDIRINNNPIDSSKIYNIVTTDFLLDGGDNYTVFKNNKGVYNTSMPVRNVVSEYVKTLEMPIAPVTDERIKVIELHSLEGPQKKI